MIIKKFTVESSQITEILRCDWKNCERKAKFTIGQAHKHIEEALIAEWSKAMSLTSHCL